VNAFERAAHERRTSLVGELIGDPEGFHALFVGQQYDGPIITSTIRRFLPQLWVASILRPRIAVRHRWRRSESRELTFVDRFHDTRTRTLIEPFESRTSANAVSAASVL
jgi:hypothetical protein